MGRRPTSDADATPPLLFMTANGGGGASSFAVSSAKRSAIEATYRATRGFTATSTRVVMVRSYSRYSGSTSLLIDTTASGCSRASTSRIASSCAGFA